MSSGILEPGTFCCICFAALTPETCVVDEDGTTWDVCKGDCAYEAGITERKQGGSDNHSQ